MTWAVGSEGVSPADDGPCPKGAQWLGIAHHFFFREARWDVSLHPFAPFE